MSTKAKLYGGAIECNIPAGFDDVSKFRVVPDHQEVYANAETDQSIIVEINERVRLLFIFDDK